jgi:hypothetical protein
MSIRNPSVIYESQTLTEEQKATVCGNIGAQPAVSGKSLSTNDYTNEDQSKLQGIEAGADVNTIESISVDGTTITPDAHKDVAIPIAQSATTDPVAPATTGLMSGTDKAKLDAYAAVPAVANRSGKFMKDDGTWSDALTVHEIKWVASTMTVEDVDTDQTTTVDVWVLAEMDGTTILTTSDIVAMIDAQEQIYLVGDYVSNDSKYVLNDYDIFESGNDVELTLNFISAYDYDNGYISSRVAHLQTLDDDSDRVGCVKESGMDDPFVAYHPDPDWPVAGNGLIYGGTNLDTLMINSTGTATGANAFAEGVGTEASAQGSHAEGGNTRAIYSWSHAEGYNTEANGNGAHAEGVDTNANEQGAHAGGYGAHTTGVGNFIHGTFLNYDSGTSKTLVKNLPTVVLGTLNATQAQDLNDHGGYLIIVGNGDYISGGSGTRRDGFILHKDGTVKATAFQNASGTDNAVSYAGTSGVAFNGVNNIEVFAANSVDTSSFPNDGVLRIILES